MRAAAEGHRGCHRGHHQAIEERSRELATAVADQKNFVFVGDGPNYATALFSAAKVIEAAGRHAMGQDTEEWAHLQYFVNVDPATPTFIISPAGRGHGRAAELVERHAPNRADVIAVVPEGDQADRGSGGLGCCRSSARCPRSSARWSMRLPESSFPRYLSQAVERASIPGLRWCLRRQPGSRSATAPSSTECRCRSD